MRRRLRAALQILIADNIFAHFDQAMDFVFIPAPMVRTLAFSALQNDLKEAIENLRQQQGRL